MNNLAAIYANVKAHTIGIRAFSCENLKLALLVASAVSLRNFKSCVVTHDVLGCYHHVVQHVIYDVINRAILNDLYVLPTTNGIVKS